MRNPPRYTKRFVDGVTARGPSRSVPSSKPRSHRDGLPRSIPPRLRSDFENVYAGTDGCVALRLVRCCICISRSGFVASGTLRSQPTHCSFVVTMAESCECTPGSTTSNVARPAVPPVLSGSDALAVSKLETMSRIATLTALFSLRRNEMDIPLSVSPSLEVVGPASPLFEVVAKPATPPRPRAITTSSSLMKRSAISASTSAVSLPLCAFPSPSPVLPPFPPPRPASCVLIAMRIFSKSASCFKS